MLEIAWKTYLYTWYLFEEGEEVVYRLFTCNLLSVLIVSVRFAESTKGHTVNDVEPAMLG